MGRPRSNIEPRIVHAARKLFVARGVAGSSLRAIAREAGTGIGMIYYYFTTKDELFLAVVEEIYHALLDDLGEALSGGDTLEARLRKMSERIGNMSDDERDVAKLIVREMLSSSSRRGRLIERFQRGHLGMIVQAVAEGVTNDEIDTRHHPFVVTMATFALGALPHMVRQLAGDVPPFSTAPQGTELASQLIDILFHGIAPKPSPPKET